MLFRSIAMAEAGEGDALTATEARLQDIAAGDADADAWRPLSAVSQEATERAELGEAKGISTGFDRLDAVTGGLQAGTLWVIGGASSMGKSIFGAALARNVASQGYGVGEIHLEMDETQVGLRAATALAFRLQRQGYDERSNPHYLGAMRDRKSVV